MKEEELEEPKEEKNNNLIIATEILSELTKEDIDEILKKEIVWHKIRLNSWEYLTYEGFKLNGEVIVIDITNKSWVKQLGSISNLDNCRILGVENIIKRHIVHCRCKSSVIIKENSVYCERCKYKIPFKSICYKSNLENKLIHTKNIIIGEALVDNGDKPILLIDLEYVRRKNPL